MLLAVGFRGLLAMRVRLVPVVGPVMTAVSVQHTGFLPGMFVTGNSDQNKAGEGGKKSETRDHGEQMGKRIIKLAMTSAQANPIFLLAVRGFSPCNPGLIQPNHARARLP